MAKKSFQDYFILFFMFIAVVLQIATLSLLLSTKVSPSNNNEVTLYRDVLENINEIYSDAQFDNVDFNDSKKNGDVKLRTVFIILGPILLLSLTLLLLINHFLIKNKIISIILSGLLILVSLYVIISNYRLDYPFWEIEVESEKSKIFKNFYWGLLIYYVDDDDKIDKRIITIIRLLNMLMTIVFSAFYFIYVLK